MCGICCVFQERNGISFSDVLETSSISNRGPDSRRSHSVDVMRDASLLFGGFVLHLRGSLTVQPLVDDAGNVFLWNGEVFGGINVGEEENDTRVLFQKLALAESDDDLLNLVSVVQGPMAFIFWQASKKRLWFGRDVFGRRSLLWHLPRDETDVFALSSVQLQSHEIPSVGVYCVTFGPENTELRPIPRLTLFPWKDGTWPGSLEPVFPENFTKKVYPDATYFEMKLVENVAIPSYMPCLNKELPPLDYQLHPGKCAAAAEELNADFLSSVLECNDVLSKAVDQLKSVLCKAVQKRVHNVPARTTPSGKEKKTLSSAVNPNSERGHAVGVVPAKIAVLFSGGIDSTVIAALVDRCLPPDEPIDLINVAFELRQKEPVLNKKGKPVQQNHRETKNANSECKFSVPDRLTGYTALAELNPERMWNFIEVNVTEKELQDFRNETVRHLIYPLDSVLDDSIGCALWFAGRGQGILGSGPYRGQEYTSNAKVVLCGMGADEQLAGYSRHRVCYKERGWQGLLDEVDMEMKRISARNLGRDDRIIGDHGREARFPFLDEDVVTFLASLPMHVKADLSLPRGVGEKLLLRLFALQLGLTSTAVLPKRAIQFGSRIAKLENRKEKASDVCARLAD